MNTANESAHSDWKITPHFEQSPNLSSVQTAVLHYALPIIQSIADQLLFDVVLRYVHENNIIYQLACARHRLKALLTLSDTNGKHVIYVIGSDCYRLRMFSYKSWTAVGNHS